MSGMRSASALADVRAPPTKFESQRSTRPLRAAHVEGRVRNGAGAQWGGCAMGRVRNGTGAQWADWLARLMLENQRTSITTVTNTTVMAVSSAM